ncbi:cell division protein FtsL [Marinomonas mediterranea]|uniref:cell division protein FtsL n=1 Tax=Marinomonas mediterranea TaxID=119864 RepID=UPI00234AAA94|nr:cell division protein FtsL [Marinomonas mediterranea]WCN09718.1 cell division protein FtsL [Marinomonas mediterranea]
MTKERWLLLYVLAVTLVVAFAIVLIVQVYEFRKDFSYLQSLKKEEVNLEVVWGQLLLEQSALTQPSRLEQAAVKELNMHAPSQKELIIVKP